MIRPSSMEFALRTAIATAGDFLLAFGALAAVVYVRRTVHFGFTRSLLPPENLRIDAISVLLFCGSLLAGLAIGGFYRRRIMPTEKPALLTALIIQVALIAIGGEAADRRFARTVVAGVVIVEAIAIPLWRRLLTVSLPIRPRDTILVGDAAHVRATVEGLASARDKRVRVIGWAGPMDGSIPVPWLGLPDDPAVRASLRTVEEVIYASPEGSPRSRLDLLRIRGPRGYLLLASPADALIGSSMLGWAGDRPLFEIAIRCGYGKRALLKRTMDLILGTILIIAALPIGLAAALAVWLDERGSVLIRQWRVGRNGVPFRMWKFRSMHVPSVAGSDGNTVTRPGAVLRRYRLDELPQLLNVLAGEMSLVGPRPEQPDIAAAIATELPEFELRTMVKPGIAGLAQVSANYDSGPEVKLRYDLSYMCGWSLMLDLRLLFASVSSSLSGSGR